MPLKGEVAVGGTIGSYYLDARLEGEVRYVLMKWRSGAAMTR